MTNGSRSFYTRDDWQPLLDPALEILIREDNTAADSRAALEGAVAITTATGKKPTLDDVLRIARVVIKELNRDSGKIPTSKGKHR